ncbi:MAG TPA: RdgB/HAM1 family non-canonical purine NTP pyrophosphatase, partial [Candidatus Pacearchaeota archaeon]|nr:RdgB/HAM1 family non-canonical purine NTP pyrophosphatase [Candidatus Pacearchaeota archaeon]
MILITGNKNKVKEFEFILGFKIENIDLQLEEIQSIDVEEVAKHKAKSAYNILKKPVIVEDTGLYFEELNGLPGALVKFFVKNISLEKICSLIKENRKAKTITCIVFFDGEKEIIAKGETKGSIALKPKGNNGFGWDPIFIPEGYDKTFAELTSEEKQSKFMRQEAIAELRKKLIT